MKFTTAVAAFLAAASPLVSAQDDVEVKVLGEINLVLADYTEVYSATDACYTRPSGATEVRGINIRADDEITGLQCVFYSDPDCQGKQYTRNEGNKPLEKPLVIGSWICSAGEDED